MPTKPFDIIDLIRLKQSGLISQHTSLEHHPEMLYIGCIDARLDPINDIGIDKGKALIYRNIGALVPPQGNGAANPEAVSVGAAIEFFLKIPPKDGKIKHIVVSGHTHCGGIKHACEHNHEHGDKGFLMRYLSLLTDAVGKVFGVEKAGANDAARLRQVEHESVRHSIDNLMQYDVVKEALKHEKVEIHGWIINTATQHIEEMEKDDSGKFTGKFVEMSENRQANVTRA